MPAGGLKADRRLYLTADKSRVVEHNDPDSAWLLCPAGRIIAADEVERLGLVLRDGRVVQGSAEPVVDPAPVVAPVAEEPEAKVEPVRRRTKKSDG